MPRIEIDLGATLTPSSDIVAKLLPLVVDGFDKQLLDPALTPAQRLDIELSRDLMVEAYPAIARHLDLTEDAQGTLNALASSIANIVGSCSSLICRGDTALTLQLVVAICQGAAHRAIQRVTEPGGEHNTHYEARISSPGEGRA